MKRLTRYFMEGLLFLVPVVATVYVVYMIFTKVDGIFRFKIPGFGFLVTLLLITVIGFLSSFFFTSRLTGIIDRLFSRLPLVKMIYTSVKDLIGAFVGDKKSFNKPVRVRLMQGSEVAVLGFVTSDNLASLGLDGLVSVYLPQSYNFAGNLIVVPASMVEPLKADSGNVMAFIVSGGVSLKHS